MNQLEAKKKALVAESEVIRETMKLELHNLRLFGVQAKQKFTSFGSPNRLLLLGAPLAGLLLRRKRGSFLRRAAMGLVTYQFSNRVLPLLSGLFSTSKRWSGSTPSCADKIEPAKR
jgi:hypothetical protein